MRTTMTDPWAIADGYEDALGVWRPLAPRTRRSLREAMGADGDAPPPAPVIVARAGAPCAIPGPGRLALEDGGVLTVGDGLPPDVPLGYHTLSTDATAEPITLIVAPARCVLPPARAWGWAAQLYATRSTMSWGLGDLADLHRLGIWAKGLGASMLLINPLSAPLPLPTQQASPYCPSSRRFLNPLYLRVEDMPGVGALGAELERLTALGRALNSDRLIDRERVFALKMQALERLWERDGGRDAAFERYLADRGAALRDFAIFCALAEHHRAGFRAWPAEHRRPDAPGIGPFARAHAGRVRFHQWLQWHLDTQLARAAGTIRVMQDLPIGVDPDGADAWAWQDVLTTGATVGAPPDRYVKHGQDWGLPPFVPHRLRALGYRPFVETIRAALRHAGGLRIDHVMGLFRLFWIPAGAAPADGGYVRYPADDLLAVVALESRRAGAFVVGEDLGTVETGVRERLAEHGVLSYRVMWFEDGPTSRYPELAMAAITTHDLPTVAGLWTGADLGEQARLGLEPNVAALEATRQRLAAATGATAASRIEDVVEAAHRLLAAAPSRLVTATLDDALAVRERPNLPGTTHERPNWSLALPAPLETLPTTPLALRVAAALDSRGADRRTDVAAGE
jgi:4-alpha-glucanotransferase